MDNRGEELKEFLNMLDRQVKTSNFYGQGVTLRCLGHLTKTLGYLVDSCELYVSACNLFRKVNDHYAEAAVLLDLAQALESLGHRDIAIEVSLEADRILKAATMEKAVLHAGR